MDERKWAKRFQEDVDRLIEQGQFPDGEAQPDEYRQMLTTTSRLSSADASAEASFRIDLQQRLQQKAQEELPQQIRQKQARHNFSHAFQVGLGIVLLLALVFGLNWVFSNLKPATIVGVPGKSTETIVPSIQPTSTNSAGPITDFPLSVGTQWIYSYQEYQPIASDPNQTMTATGYITETIVNTQQMGNLFLAQVDRDRHFIDVPAGWMESPTAVSTSFWYVVAGQKVYESPNLPENTQNFTDTLPLQYDFPLSSGKSWCPVQVDLKDPNHRQITDCTAAGKQTVKEERPYETPAGNFEHCFTIIQDYNSGGENQWFCKGIGMVASQYDHSGTLFGYHQTLIQFTSGSSQAILPTRTLQAPNPTPKPAIEVTKPQLTLDQLKNMQYCQPNYCWADMKDGKFGNGDKSGELVEPVAFGDLNSDGWEDAVVTIRESYSGQSSYDLVAVLNNNGQPGETIEKPLPNNAVIESTQIEKGQIVASLTISTSLNSTGTALTGMTQMYILAGQNLVQVRLGSQTQDGKVHTLALELPSNPVITTSSTVIQGKLSTSHTNLKLIYNLYDQNENQVYNAESSATVSETGDFGLPIDLGWVQPGKLRLEVLDSYSAPDLVMDLASDSINIDYEPTDQAAHPALFTYFHMIDMQTGWARSAASGDLLRTNDGGLTWQKTSLAYSGPFVLDILDRNTAWLLGQDQSQSQQVLYHTGDGGETWNQLPDLPSQFGSVYFLDAQHGFFEDHPGGSYMMGQTRFVLYDTQDGGQTWEKVFDNTPGGAQENQDPTRGHMIFRDPQNGWTVDSVIGMVMPNSLYLMRTRDGGHTWADAAPSLPMPSVPDNTFLSQQDLQFFGQERAIMPLLITSSNSPSTHVQLFISKDGGESWSLTTPIETQSNNPAVDILSADTVIVWDGKSLQMTKDAGATWSSQPVNTDFSGSLSGIQFVSPSVGFALVNDHNSNVMNTDLYKTNDGGQTWEKIDAEIGR